MTNFELSILALVCGGSGGLLVRDIVREGGGMLKRNSVYKTLRGLESKRLVKARADPAESAARFSATRAGRSALEWRTRVATGVEAAVDDEGDDVVSTRIDTPASAVPVRLSALERLCLELLDQVGGQRGAAWFVRSGGGWLTTANARPTLHRMARRGYLIAWHRVADSGKGKVLPREYSMSEAGKRRLEQEIGGPYWKGA